jgi:hypothetical protein
VLVVGAEGSSEQHRWELLASAGLQTARLRPFVERLDQDFSVDAKGGTRRLRISFAARVST